MFTRTPPNVTKLCLIFSVLASSTALAGTNSYFGKFSAPGGSCTTTGQLAGPNWNGYVNDSTSASITVWCPLQSSTPAQSGSSVTLSLASLEYQDSNSSAHFSCQPIQFSPSGGLHSGDNLETCSTVTGCAYGTAGAASFVGSGFLLWTGAAGLGIGITSMNGSVGFLCSIPPKVGSDWSIINNYGISANIVQTGTITP